MAEEKNLIEITHISKKFGVLTVLKDISVKCDGSRRRCFKPIDAAQQRTLPRAGRSDDDDDGIHHI